MTGSFHTLLPIFPEGGLAESVVTTVWIGIFALCIGNLRFGWTLSGLVTPGYLVPILISRPMAAAVILFEAVLAYWIVFLLSERFASPSRWSSFFGRDRFFALVLASIVLRVALDGYFLPWIARQAVGTPWETLELGSNLHSFGLIIVALIANQFWKPGLRRGVLPLVVTTGITYFIVKYPLSYLTNFNLGSLEIIYDDLATSVLSSPKAYIVLLTTSIIASRLNLLYSWDFNGILVPSLLALQCHQPRKILTSFVEAYAIYAIARALLKLPFLKEITIEGARKVLLFFNISFLYKLVLGHVLLALMVSPTIPDYYGFGYLLPSLLAIKMHDKNIPTRLARTTLQAAALGAVLSTSAGFLFTFLSEIPVAQAGASTTSKVARVEETNQSVLFELQELKQTLYTHQHESLPPPPMPKEVHAFGMACRRLRSSMERDTEVDLQQVAAELAEAGYRLSKTSDNLLYLRPRDTNLSWGAYIINPRQAKPLLVQVPFPITEWSTLEAGAYLFHAQSAAALAISTSERASFNLGVSQLLVSHNQFFQLFQKIFGSREVLQARGLTPTIAAVNNRAKAPTSQPEDATSPAHGLHSELWVTRGLPPSLDLRLLDTLLPTLQIHWQGSPIKNAFRDLTNGPMAELFLTMDDRKSVLATCLIALGGRQVAMDRPQGLPSVIDTSLREWVTERKSTLAARASEGYVPPDLGTLLYFDQEIVQPVLSLLDQESLRPSDPGALQGALKHVHTAAAFVNYGVSFLPAKDGHDAMIILDEATDGGPMRHWGTFIFRMAPKTGFGISVPRPLFERDTIEYGAELFESKPASFLFIAGAHPMANKDGSADMVLPSNKSTVFNLVHQATFRYYATSPLLIIQVRALAPKGGTVLPAFDALLSFSSAATSWIELSPLAREVVDYMIERHVDWKLFDGTPLTLGYDFHGSIQAQYLAHTKNKEFLSLWVSPFVRQAVARSVTLEGPSLQEPAVTMNDFPTGLVALLEAESFRTESRDSSTSLIAHLCASPEEAMHPRGVKDLATQLGARAVFLSLGDSGELLVLFYRAERLLPVIGKVLTDFGDPDESCQQVIDGLPDENELLNYLRASTLYLIFGHHGRP